MKMWLKYKELSMKTTIKLVGIIALAIVIGFSMAACKSILDELTLTGTVSVDNTTPKVGDLLTAYYSNGNGQGFPTWQWMQGDSTPIGTNSKYYSVTENDLGKRIRVQVSFPILKGFIEGVPTEAVARPSNAVCEECGQYPCVCEDICEECGEYPCVCEGLLTPEAGHFDISGLTTTYDGTVKQVIITAKEGKSDGDITVYYNYDEEPIAAGAYTVTFDIARTEDWKAVTGLSAGTLTINRKPVTITGLVASNRVYNGNTAVTITGNAVVTGKVGADDVTVDTTGATAAFADKNAGNGKAVIFTGYSLEGADVDNYSLPLQPAATANITPLQLTISAPTVTGGQPTKVYDGTAAYTGGGITIGTLAGVINGDAVNISAAGMAYSSPNVVSPNPIIISYSVSGAAAANYFAPVNGTVTADISRRPVTVTPDPGKSKAYGAADPAFTYTLSEPLIAGNSFSGSLSYSYNGSVGIYPIIRGSLSAGNNYELTVAGGVTFEIVKAAGAAVSAPVSASITQDSITINAVTAPGNGQTVEYAISISNTAPEIGWQDGLVFSGLHHGTTYNVFARSKESVTANAGVPVSTPITVSIIESNLGITYDQITDQAPNISSGITIYRVTYNGTTRPQTATLTVTNPGIYNSISWRVQNTNITGTGASFTLNAANPAYNLLGEHFVTVLVIINGVPFTKLISFTVEY